MSASSNPAEKAAFMNSETSWMKLGGDTISFKLNVTIIELIICPFSFALQRFKHRKILRLKTTFLSLQLV
jgi:hypothetical protein